MADQFGEGGQICSGQSHDQGMQSHPPNSVSNTALAERHSRAACLEVKRFTLFLVAFDRLYLSGGHSYLVSSLTVSACFDFLFLLANAFVCWVSGPQETQQTWDWVAC